MLSFLTKSFLLLVWVVSFAERVPAQDPDINGDGSVNCHDAEAVQFAVRDGIPNPPFGGSLDNWLDAAADTLGYDVIHGDTDVDGDVDRWDFHRLAGNHFIRVGVEVFNGWCRGQFDYDGIINSVDRNELGRNWGRKENRLATTPGGIAEVELFLIVTSAT